MTRFFLTASICLLLSVSALVGSADESVLDLSTLGLDGEAEGALTAALDERCTLIVQNHDPEDASGSGGWRLRCQGVADRFLGDGLSAMYQVAQLLPSPDHRWLAVVSVGEGHPILEIVDAQKLLRQQEYAVAHEINPYPGTLLADRWDGDALLISSDVALELGERRDRAASDPLLPETGEFRLVAGSWNVESAAGREEACHE